MTQKKKDFTKTAAEVFVEKMMTPQATQTEAKPAAAQRANKARAEVKATFMIDADVEHKLRYVCFAERRKQKDVLNAALREYIERYEAEHGRIK